MSQNEAILDYMRRNGSITGLQATSELGIMRLASRIHEIRESGIAVKDAMVFKRDENGKIIKKWKEYWV